MRCRSTEYSPHIFVSDRRDGGGRGRGGFGGRGGFDRGGRGGFDRGGRGGGGPMRGRGGDRDRSRPY